MSLLKPINLLVSNIGSTFEAVILILVSLACLIVAGKDIRLGAIFFFLSTGLIFIWFKAFEITQGLNATLALYVFLGSIILLALTLLVTTKPQQGGYFL